MQSFQSHRSVGNTFEGAPFPRAYPAMMEPRKRLTWHVEAQKNQKGSPPFRSQLRGTDCRLSFDELFLSLHSFHSHSRGRIPP